MTPEQVAAIERLKELRDSCFYFDYFVALSESGMPLIEALQAENERLRAGIGRALEHLNRFECRQLAAVIDAAKELEALHDA